MKGVLTPPVIFFVAHKLGVLYERLLYTRMYLTEYRDRASARRVFVP